MFRCDIFLYFPGAEAALSRYRPGTKTNYSTLSLKPEPLEVEAPWSTGDISQVFCLTPTVDIKSTDWGGTALLSGIHERVRSPTSALRPPVCSGLEVQPWDRHGGVCVCEREREREGERTTVCVCERER